MRNGPAPRSAFEEITYRPFRPRIWQASSDVAVSRGGVILSPRWFNRTLYKRLYVMLHVAAIAIGSRLQRGSEAVNSELPLGVIHSIWSAGYYHWITESLPRAMALRAACPQVVPVLPQDHYEAYADTLSALGFDRIQWFPSGKNAVLKHPWISECPPMFGTTDPALLRDLRATIVSNLKLVKDENALGVVYVSRAKARGRRVANEVEVEKMLAEFKVTSVCFEDLSFVQQVALMFKTRLLISIHGAALTNMIWMQRGGSVIELLPYRNGLFDWNVVRRSFRHDACYVRLAEAMDLHHHGMLCKAQHGLFEETWQADVTVNVEELRHVVRGILK